MRLLAEVDNLHKRCSLMVITGCAFLPMPLCGSVFGMMPAGGRGRTNIPSIAREQNPLRLWFNVALIGAAEIGLLVAGAWGLFSLRVQ
jgi:hypothetical protein